MDYDYLTRNRHRVRFLPRFQPIIHSFATVSNVSFRIGLYSVSFFSLTASMLAVFRITLLITSADALLQKAG